MAGERLDRVNFIRQLGGVQDSCARLLIHELLCRIEKLEAALEAFDRAANPETERGTPVANARETAAEAGKPSNR